MKQFYMSRRFWKEIRPIIPRKPRVGRPRKGAKKIMNALHYVLRTGIPWKALPPGFGVSASTVHRRFREWIEDGVFRSFWAKILKKYKHKNSDMMKWIAIDGSHSKSPLGGEKVGNSPVDRRKLGTKKHICVDQNGVVLGIAISGAHRHDNLLVKETIDSIPIKLEHSNIVCAADSAYDSKNTRTFLKSRGLVPLITKNRRSSAKKPPKTTSICRWIVE